MSSEIHKADPRIRRLAWGLAIVFILALGFGLEQMHRRLEAAQALSQRSERLAAETTLELASLFFGGVAVGCFIFGLCLIYEAVRVLRSDRYPAEGAWMLRDTPVVRGPAARRRAWIALALALPILVLGFELRRRGIEHFERSLAELLAPDDGAEGDSEAARPADSPPN